MSLTSRKVHLDNSGNGSVHIPPCWFAGAESGGSSVAVQDAAGGTIHAAGAAPYWLAFGSMIPVMGGRVDVVGGAHNGEALLYFDFQ